MIHQDDLESWCPRKYVENCRQQDAVVKWEEDSQSPAFINPACGCAAKQFLTWPFFCVGLSSVFFVLCLLTTGGCDIFMSDSRSVHFEMSSRGRKPSVLVPILALLASLLLIGAYVTYVYFTPAAKAGKMNQALRSFMEPESYPDKDFVIVDRQIIFKNQARQ